MGLFSNTCVKCSAKVKKDAAFCPACGSPAPGGTSHCSKCNAQVGSIDKFCGRCGADLQVYAPVQLVDNRWVRDEDEFAVRVEAHDLEGWLRKGLIVEPGTQAVLIQRGRSAGTLPPGRYELDGFLSHVNNFNLKSLAAVILMSATDTLIPLEFSNLRTREGLPVHVRCRIVLALANPENFAFRLMAGKERVTVAELQETLVDEAHNVLQALINQTGMDELYGNLDFKTQVEERLQEELRRTLERSGLDLVRLHFIDYAGEVYERLRQMRGDIYMANREAEELAAHAEIAKRMRQTLTQERMAKFKDAAELEEFMHQTEHELGLKGVIRENEMEDLKRTFGSLPLEEAWMERASVTAMWHEILLHLDAPATHTLRERFRRERLLRCPYCTEEIDRQAAYCPQCGGEVPSYLRKKHYTFGIDLSEHPPCLSARFVFQASKKEVYVFTKPQVTLGRQQGNDIVLRLFPPTEENNQRSLRISRQHAQLLWERDNVRLQTFRPIFIAGKEVKDTILEDGMIMVFGGVLKLKVSLFRDKRVRLDATHSLPGSIEDFRTVTDENIPAEAQPTSVGALLAIRLQRLDNLAGREEL